MRAWTLGLSWVLVVTPAFAQPADGAAGDEPSTESKREAFTRFQRGLDFYDEGEYELALIEFERAYDTIPDYRVLYNIGQVCIQLGHFTRARGALTRYLEVGGSAIDAERIQAVEADLAMLRGRTAHLSISANVEGARVLIDGVLVGETPLAEVLVDAGEHEVELQLPGYMGIPRSVRLAGGDQLAVDITLDPITPAPPPPSPPPQTAPPPQPTAPPPDIVDEPSRPPLWVGWVATGALTAAATTSFALGVSSANKLDDLRRTPDVPQEDLDTEEQRARTRLNLAGGLAVGAVAAGGITLVLTLRQRRRAHSPSEDQRAHRVTLGVTPRGATLRGRF